jgi:hypothetical protein
VTVRNAEVFNYKIDAALTIEAEITVKDKRKIDNPKKRKVGKYQGGKKKKAPMPKTLNMTSTMNNIFEGQEVCFEVNIAFGTKLLQHFQFDSFPLDSLQCCNENVYFFGAVGEILKSTVIAQV